MRFVLDQHVRVLRDSIADELCQQVHKEYPAFRLTALGLERKCDLAETGSEARCD